MFSALKPVLEQLSTNVKKAPVVVVAAVQAKPPGVIAGGDRTGDRDRGEGLL